MGITKHGLLAQLEQEASFTKAERRLADWIHQFPHKVLNLSARELAEKAGVSEATVIRTCQRLGYSGYPQFKLSLAFEMSTQAGTTATLMGGDIEAHDDLETIVSKVFHARMDSLQRSFEFLNQDNFAKAVDAIAEASKVLVIASGTQSHFADRVCSRMTLTSTHCVGLNDPALQLASASIMSPTDVLLIFGHSGRWKIHVKAVELARQRGAKTIAVTNFEQSPLGRAADIPIITHGDDTVFFSESMGSEVAMAVIVDCLIIAIANRKRDIVIPNLVTTRTVLEENLRQ